MTLIEISNNCPSDAEFLNHPNVRRAWWKCMGNNGPWKHQIDYNTLLRVRFCHKCRLTDPYALDADCSMPDPIPHDIANAAEVLREKVAQQWNGVPDYDYEVLQAFMERTHAAATDTDELEDGFAYFFDSPRQRFIVFATALLDAKE